MKTIFKISAVIFLLNVFNLVLSFTCLLFKAFNCFQTNNSFFEYMFAWTALLFLPLCVLLIGLLSYPHKPIKIWKWNLK